MNGGMPMKILFHQLKQREADGKTSNGLERKKYGSRKDEPLPEKNIYLLFRTGFYREPLHGICLCCR